MRLVRFICILATACVVATICACSIGTEHNSGSTTGAPKRTKVRPMSDPDLVDEDAPEEFTQTASGLKYRIRRKSDGKKPTAADSVSAHYRGWIDDGRVFDSSYDRGAPTTFPLNRVIKGWTEGLQLIGEGGMIELEIPADLGYGAGGSPPKIPPNATLHFLVELIEVR